MHLQRARKLRVKLQNEGKYSYTSYPKKREQKNQMEMFSRSIEKKRTKITGIKQESSIYRLFFNVNAATFAKPIRLQIRA